MPTAAPSLCRWFLESQIRYRSYAEIISYQLKQFWFEKLEWTRALKTYPLRHSSVLELSKLHSSYTWLNGNPHKFCVKQCTFVEVLSLFGICFVVPKFIIGESLCGPPRGIFVSENSGENALSGRGAHNLNYNQRMSNFRSALWQIKGVRF